MAHFEVASETVRVQANLGEIVKNCIAGFIPIAQRRGIDLGMTHDETAYILASTDDLRTLFDNLLDNAVRYTQDGGQIDVSVEVLGKKAVVTIMDNGPGIPMALLPRVFDRFFRVGDNEIEGSGIGLAIVNAIVKRESAEIKLNNRQDTNGLSALVTFDISES
jgi:signal transduction histidine kinase